MKEYRGFYHSNYNKQNYCNITNEAENIFGKNIIRSALYEIGYHYGYNDEMEEESFEEYVDREYNSLIFDSKIDFSKEIDIGGISIIIELINGVKLYINSSEWGSIKRL